MPLSISLRKRALASARRKVRPVPSHSDLCPGVGLPEGETRSQCCFSCKACCPCSGFPPEAGSGGSCSLHLAARSCALDCFPDAWAPLTVPGRSSVCMQSGETMSAIVPRSRPGNEHLHDTRFAPIRRVQGVSRLVCLPLHRREIARTPIGLTSKLRRARQAECIERGSPRTSL